MKSQLYPSKFFLLTGYEPGKTVFSAFLWNATRGFTPKYPLVQGQFLVVHLYDMFNKRVSTQLRDTSTDDPEKKYLLVNKIEDILVKTDKDDLQGKEIIVEGTVDCALLRAHGINAWTCLGLKPYRVRQLKKLLQEDESIPCLFDNDIAGRIVRNLLLKYAPMHTVPLQFKDLNEFYLTDQAWAEEWMKDLKEKLR